MINLITKILGTAGKSFRRHKVLKMRCSILFYIVSGFFLLLFFNNCSAKQSQNYLSKGGKIVSMEEKRAYYSDKLEYFKPLLNLQEEGLDPNMVQVSGQGLKLPEPDQIIQNALDESSQISVIKVENIVWVKKVIKNKWLPPNLSDILIAVPDAVNEDAFVGAWHVEGQIFQLIITKRRLHLLTDKKLKQGADVPKDKKEYALYCADHYLNLREPIESSKWKLREFGGLLLGYREYSYYKHWEHSLIFLTDGQGVKLSIIKAEGENSPPQRSSPSRSAFPWFTIHSKG